MTNPVERSRPVCRAAFRQPALRGLLRRPAGWMRPIYRAPRALCAAQELGCALPERVNRERFRR